MVHCVVMEDILSTRKGDLLVIKMVSPDHNIDVREILVLALIKILQKKKISHLFITKLVVTTDQWQLELLI